MADEHDSRILTIIGFEEAGISLEEYANFLRDLVFLHDRIAILAGLGERGYKLYYSNWFYVRDQPRVPADYMLRLRSSHIGSPFELKLELNVGEWLQGAAKAFVEILRGVSTLPEYRRGEQLNNRLLEATVRTAEAEQRLREAQAESATSLIRAAEQIRELPRMREEGSEDKIRFVQKDIERLSDSHLRITSVEVERENREQS